MVKTLIGAASRRAIEEYYRLHKFEDNHNVYQLYEKSYKEDEDDP
jgi:hypothetical protein